MTQEEIKSIAKELAAPRLKPVYDEAFAQRSVSIMATMRNAIRTGDTLKATLAEGELKGLENFYYAMRDLAKEG